MATAKHQEEYEERVIQQMATQMNCSVAQARELRAKILNRKRATFTEAEWRERLAASREEA